MAKQSVINVGELPIPDFYLHNSSDPDNVGQLRFVDYPTMTRVAREWAERNNIRPAATDKVRICNVPIDVQNTFCMAKGGLPVIGALEATVRAVKFGYRNVHRITQYAPTMDTHTVFQIFHEAILVDQNGNHPAPGTMISSADMKSGKWSANPAAVQAFLNDPGLYNYMREYLTYYAGALEAAGKYAWTVWPYHGLIGGVEHALVPDLHEHMFFHSIARNAALNPQIKGGNPLTENYSPLRPEVVKDHLGRPNGGQKNTNFIKMLLSFDYIVAWGFASSHCFAWFVDDLLNEIMAQDKKLVSKVYLLKDCTAPVVIPGVIDFTQQAEDAFNKFANAGMHVVNSTEPMENWPGMNL